MAALIDDLLACMKAALDEWRFRRHLRRGGCPDELPF
jgi:hypothetical protein